MTLPKRIRIANTLRTVALDVHPCKYRDIRTWHRTIHDPFIERRGGIDCDWDWRRLFLGCHMSEALLGREALTFQLRVANERDEAIPVAQATFSYPYAWPANPQERCVFIWLVSGAPPEALTFYLVRDRPVVLPAVLDIAIQLSIANGLQGRIGLHAAVGASQEESDQLAKKYAGYGLQQRQQTDGYFRWPVRPDDGRFFYFAPAEAQAFSAAQDDLR